MPLEIERKFLVRDGWPRNTGGEPYRQGYLKQSGDPPTIRVRRAGDLAFLTIKSQPAGLVRDEYEYRIPVDHAEEMLASLCHHPLIEKVRPRCLMPEWSGRSMSSKVLTPGLLWPRSSFTTPTSRLRSLNGLVSRSSEIRRTRTQPCRGIRTLPGWTPIRRTERRDVLPSSRRPSD